MSMRARAVSPTSLEAEAAEWLVAHDRGLTSEEVRAFRDWLNASATHAEIWRNAELTWNAFGSLEKSQLRTLRDEALAMRPPLWRRPAPATLVALIVFLVFGAAAWSLQYL